MTDLVPVDPFQLGERIAKSMLIPQAYRGKPVDAAICIMYGAEVGLSPMTALQRIIVINGKPTLDAQGMAALIRGAGHSIMGETSNESATVTGKRADNGDTMSVTFTIDDAKRAGLVKNGPWTQYPSSMLWARAVSKLARELFPDVLMGMSYVPEEIGGPVDEGEFLQPASPALSTDEGGPHTVDPSPAQGPPPVADLDDDVVDGEIVDDLPPFVDAETGEVIEPETVQTAPNDIGEVKVIEMPTTLDELKVVLNDLINSVSDKAGLRGELTTRFGPPSNRTVEQMQECITIAAGRG